MPGSNKGNYSVAKLTRATNRAVQAEMKNKREIVRLHLQNRQLDRQLTYARYAHEKEKKTAAMFIKQMKQTTGISTEGQALDGPWDRDYAKTEYARATMGEKRIKQWRDTEEHLQKKIGHSIVQQTDDSQETEEETTNNLTVVLRMMGYDDEDIPRILSHIQIGSDRKQDRQTILQQNKKCKNLLDMDIKCFKTVPDVFGCLRPPVEEIVKGPKNPKKSSVPNPFSVKDWEKSLFEKYTSTACTQVPSSKPRRIKSAQEIAAQYRSSSAKTSNCNSSSPSTGRSSSTLSHSKAANSSGPSTGRSLDSNSLPPQKERTPVAKCVGFKEIVLEIPTEIWERVDPISVDTPASQNGHGTEGPTFIPDPTRKIRPQTTAGIRRESSLKLDRPNTAPGSSAHDLLHPSPRLASISYPDEQSNARVNFLDLSSMNETDERGQSGNQRVSDSNKPISKPNSSLDISLSGEPSRNGDVFGTDTVKELKQGFNAYSKRRSSLFSSSIKQSPTHRQKRASFSVQLAKPRSPLDRGGLLNSFKNSQDAINENDEMTEEESEALARSRRQALLMRRSSMPANIFKKRLANDSKESELVADENGTLLPRWKRDLLRESPGSLYSEKRVARSPAAISKALRLKELERLKYENVNDLRKLCGNEQERRAQSRKNIFMTMFRVKQAVDTLKVKAEETRSRSGTMSSTCSVGQDP